MCYTYVLRSLADRKFYTGSTRDLQRRLAEHQRGAVEATTIRRPLELVYYEACRNEHDARVREQYLKSAWGKRYLKNKMKGFLGEHAAPLLSTIRVTGCGPSEGQ